MTQNKQSSLTTELRLKITECFTSLQGEGTHVGLPCSFVRLTGCALRCVYCDTEYAFHGGEWWSFKKLFDWLSDQPTRLVQITGGEPLHQSAVWTFIDQLVAGGYQPLVETSGAVSIAGLHPDTHIVMDLKTPASGEESKNLWENLTLLKASDEIKFVICCLEDWLWAKIKIQEHDLDNRFNVLISPEWGWADKAKLAELVVHSGLKLRFQIQLHKVIWHDARGK